MKTTVQNESYSGWNTWSVRNAETGELITFNVIKRIAENVSRGLKYDEQFFQKFKFIVIFKETPNHNYQYLTFYTQGYKVAIDIIDDMINTNNCTYKLVSID